MLLMRRCRNGQASYPTPCGIHESERGPMAHCHDGTAAGGLDQKLLCVAGARATETIIERRATARAHPHAACEFARHAWAVRSHVQLAREGVHVGHQRAARLMRLAGLHGASRRHRPHITRQRGPERVRRRTVRWVMSSHLYTELMLRSLDLALLKRPMNRPGSASSGFWRAGTTYAACTAA
jgi:hypothetical protein